MTQKYYFDDEDLNHLTNVKAIDMNSVPKSGAQAVIDTWGAKRRFMLSEVQRLPAAIEEGGVGLGFFNKRRKGK
jgi:hypothetical protein